MSMRPGEGTDLSWIKPVQERLRRERLLDEAVRAFRRDNPMRWESASGYPCTCIGCVGTIRANFRYLAGKNA